MSQMHGACAGLAGLIVGLCANVAHAESGTCWGPLQVVEAFAGAPGCPDAQYVVVERLDAEYGWPAPLHFADSCVNWRTLEESVPDPAFTPSPDGAPGRRWLIGTPRAAEVFGISMDTMAPDLRLDPREGHVSGDCNGVSYGGGPPPAGMAFDFDGAAALSFAVAAPVNAAGEIGVFGGCSPGGGDGTDGAAADGAADGGPSPWPAPPIDCSPPDVDAGAGGGGALRDADAPPPKDARPPTAGAGGARGTGGATGSGAGGRHPTGAILDEPDAGASSGDHKASGIGTDNSGCSFTPRGSASGAPLPLVTALGVALAVLRGRRGRRGAGR